MVEAVSQRLRTSRADAGDRGDGRRPTANRGPFDTVAPAGGSTRHVRSPAGGGACTAPSISVGQVVDVSSSPAAQAPAFCGSVWFWGTSNIGMSARTPRIMRFSLASWPGTDARAAPTRSPADLAAVPPPELPVAAATRWPASWAWRPPRCWPGRGSFGLEDGPAQLARWFATVTPAPSLRPDTCLPSGRGASQIGSIEEVSASREVTWEGFFNARDLGGCQQATPA